MSINQAAHTESGPYTAPMITTTALHKAAVWTIVIGWIWAVLAVIGGIALAVQSENSGGNAGTGLAAGFVGVAFGTFFILLGTWAAAWDLRNTGN